MQAKLETKLVVNGIPIELNEVAHKFLTNIMICAVSMLKGGNNVTTLDYSLDGDQVSLIINDQIIPLSPFPRDAVKGTISGMVSSLKGVHKIDSLQVKIQMN